MAAGASPSQEVTWSNDHDATESAINNDEELNQIAAIESAINNDEELQEIAAKFENDVNITPDTDLQVDPSEIVPVDSDSSSSGSARGSDETWDGSDDSSKPLSFVVSGEPQLPLNSELVNDKSPETPTKRQKLETPKTSKINRTKVDKSRDSSDTESLKSHHGCLPSSRKNPLKMLKKLTKFDKSNRKKSQFRSEFSVVCVDRLPQVFVVKYLGHRDVSGVSGLHHVRKPVDEMVAGIRTNLDAKQELNLPLLYLIVSTKGIELREHQSNKIKKTAPVGLIPIEFISYGVQDIKYWRIFTCIIVRALSWQKRSTVCHAFLCDSSQSGRKLALALGVAFREYGKNLQANGKTHNFQVELRPPDELADGMGECDV